MATSHDKALGKKNSKQPKESGWEHSKKYGKEVYIHRGRNMGDSNSVSSKHHY